MDRLFYDSDDRLYSVNDFREALISIGAADCETLFIHSDVMFGRPAEGFKRREYLDTLYEIISGLNVKNLIVPTYTYSFCNNEDYDIAGSKTSMGAFNEHIRKFQGRYRTDDPILSVSVPESLKDIYISVSNESLGEGCALDILHNMKDVKFLFLGAEMAECFTYVHYVEKMMKVPYRFDMTFEGNVIYPDGCIKKKTQIINTQCVGVKLPSKYVYFEEEMNDKGYLKKKRVGDRYIGCISEQDAYREIREHISKDRYYFCAEPYKEEELVHQYTYSRENGRITHC